MIRMCLLSCVVALAAGVAVRGQDEPKKPPQKVPPAKIAAFQELLKGSAEDFIAKFDKNGDKQLVADEAPPFLAKSFEKADRDGNGKLDAGEVRQMLEVLRRFTPGVGAPKAGEFVTQMLQRMDKDKDGKISKSEAEGRLVQGFAQADRNSDGFLDRGELQAMAARIFQFGGPMGPGAGGPGLDFDALDKDADGRVSRAEAANSQLGRSFAEIDSDNDGQISRREFEAWSKKKQ